MKHPKSRINGLVLKQRMALLGLALCVSLTFPFIDYTRQDITISRLNELWLLFGMHTLVCCAFFALYCTTLTTKWGKLFATISSVFLLLQKFPRLYDILTKWTESWPPALNSLLVTVLVLGAIWTGTRAAEAIVQRVRPAWNNQIFVISLFVVASVVLSNSYKFASYLAHHNQAYAYKPTNLTSGTKLAKNEGRDVYYFVFDRYANQKTLQQQFNYDNSPFLNTLREQGFTIRDKAVSNYQYTAPSIASTVRMGYHTDIAKDLPGSMQPSYIPYKSIIENSPTSSLLRQAGYAIYNFGNWWNVTKKQNHAVNIEPYHLTFFGKSYNLSDMQSNGLQRTFLNNPLKQGVHIGNTSLIKMDLASPRSLYFSQIDGLNKLAKEHSAAPKFVFAHILNPHPPYVFTKTGDSAPYNGDENDIDMSRRDKYINQLEFANKGIIQLMATINKNAAKPPIIIIQADEGPYPLVPTPPWQNASNDLLQLKFGTLAAYELPDSTPEQAARANSSVNIFRYVFNHYFGTNLAYLPDCSFVFNNADKPYHYYDITAKLHTEDKECQRYN